MDISNESLNLLESIISNNPKCSMMGNPCDRGRWIGFIISNYKNREYIESWDLYDYFMDNGFDNFKEEVEELIKYYQIALDFISYIDRV